MQTIQSFASQLHNAAAGISLQQLSDQTGLDKGNLSKMLNGKSNPGIENVLKVTNALGLELNITANGTI